MPSLERSLLASPDVSSELQDVDDLLDGIAQLARSRLTAAEFGATVCHHVRRALPIDAALIWLQETGGGWHVVGQDGIAPTELLVEGPLASASDRRSLAAPFGIDGGQKGVFQIVPRSDGASLLRGGQEVIQAVAELVSDFYKSQRIGQLQNRDERWRQLGDLVCRIHESLDLDRTSYRVANECRRWLGCDRVTVTLREGSRCRVVAISGLDRVDRRADLVRVIERLAATVLISEEPLWFDNKAIDPAPQIEKLLHQFLEQAPAKVLAIVPIVKPRPTTEGKIGSPVGTLVIERFTEDSNEMSLREDVALLLPHVGSAIANAQQHDRVPLVRLFDRTAKANRLRWFVRVLLAAMAITGLTLALTLIQADFSVEARGQLQPKVSQEIFAPADGVVGDVRVRQSASVAKDSVLLTLTQPQLDLELARVNGEMQTAQKKLAATNALKLEPDRTRPDLVERMHQMTAEEEELKELIKSLERQREILTAQQSELTIRSPLDGKVLTWNVELLLAARPVQRGQHLLTVADVQGTWQITLQVPDDRMGHILSATQTQASPLNVSFVLATDSQHEYSTRLDEIAYAAEIKGDERPAVTVTAPVGSDFTGSPRPGAEVIAHIHCGQRAIGYVWLHDLFDAVRSWLYY